MENFEKSQTIEDTNAIYEQASKIADTETAHLPEPERKAKRQEIYERELAKHNLSTNTRSEDVGEIDLEKMERENKAA